MKLEVYIILGPGRWGLETTHSRSQSRHCQRRSNLYNLLVRRQSSSLCPSLRLSWSPGYLAITLKGYSKRQLSVLTGEAQWPSSWIHTLALVGIDQRNWSLWAICHKGLGNCFSLNCWKYKKQLVYTECFPALIPTDWYTSLKNVGQMSFYPFNRLIFPIFHHICQKKLSRVMHTPDT